MKLNKKQRDFVDNLREKFKADLETQKINPDNFEIYYGEGEDGDKGAKQWNELTIAGINLVSSTETMESLKNNFYEIMKRFDKNKSIQNYIG